MIVWIASYPRSGNTLTRMILKRCFDVATHAGHGAGIDRMPPDVLALIGHIDLRKPAAHFFLEARRSDESYFIKTHSLRQIRETDRAIYIVRDGRAATSSYRRWLSEFRQNEVALRDVVRGTPPLPLWAEHVRWALARDPSGTMILRYEDLAKPDAALLQRLSTFIGKPLLRTFDIRFDELNAAYPQFFGEGSNAAGVEEIEQQCHSAFWTANGEPMRLLQY